MAVLVFLDNLIQSKFHCRHALADHVDALIYKSETQITPVHNLIIQHLSDLSNIIYVYCLLVLANYILYNYLINCIVVHSLHKKIFQNSYATIIFVTIFPTNVYPVCSNRNTEFLIKLQVVLKMKT